MRCSIAIPQVRGIRVTVRKPHAPIAATFDDVGVIVTRSAGNGPRAMTMAEAFVALGGNVGDVRSTFRPGHCVALRRRRSAA